MRFELADTVPAQTTCDLLALPVHEPGTLEGEAAELDRAVGGRLGVVARDDGFTGKHGRTVLLHAPDAPFRRALLVGVGRDTAPESLRRYAAVAIRRAQDVRAVRVALVTHPPAANAAPPEERIRAVVEGAGLSAYRFDRYRQSDGAGPPSDVLLLVRGGDHATLGPAVRAGEVAVRATCRARDLVNEPPNVLIPSALADAAREAAARAGCGITVLDLDEVRTMGMGLFAAVAGGSVEPPKFIVLDYRPEGRDAAGADARRTVALVGKGITFDSGGLDVKAASGMRHMKNDMAGAAAVVAAMGALRDLAIPMRVLGIAAAAENLGSRQPMRPGDIVRALNGKTVEITNTDAEGRLVLADALAYAVREGADEVIDLATLTGSCIVALGSHTAGLMGNDQALADRLLHAAKSAGEQLWQLPLYDEFIEVVQGEISDLRNQTGREGGAQRAAAFLREFVGTTPWAHLDIAGPAWSEDKSAPAYVPQGGTGYGVRTLLRYLTAPM